MWLNEWSRRPPTPRSFAVDVARAQAAFQDLARQMGAQFLDKQEIIRLMTVSAIAGEHMVIVGPPGTAKSAMIDMFAQLIDARYFEYLLTRFTEPNELFGPVDISAFREGRYTRRLENMLPTAEIVFLDEIFKSNSAILNSLLHVINERKFQNGPEVVQVPLISLYARLERGAQRRQPGGDVRPLPRARAVATTSTAITSTS